MLYSLNMRKKAERPSLPDQGVTKQELKRLYIQEAKGIYDEELEDEIISAFIVILEGWIKWHKWNLKYEYDEEDKKAPNDFDYKHEKGLVKEKNELIQILQQAVTPQEKMIAIDQVINTVHKSGTFGLYFVEGTDLGDPFLDELGNLKISGLTMRKKAYIVYDDKGRKFEVSS